MAFHIVFAALLLSVQVVAETSIPTQKDDSHSASFLNGLRPVRERELLFLHDQIQQGDALLKERLQARFQFVNEALKEGDAQLKEQLVSGDARLKEQLREGDERLKQEITQDELWVKDRLTRVEGRLKEELSEGEEKMKEVLEEQKNEMKNLQDFVKEWAKRNDAVMAQQAEQLSELKTKLQLSETSLQAVKDQLRTSRADLQSSQETVQNLEAEMKSWREGKKGSEKKKTKATESTDTMPATGLGRESGLRVTGRTEDGWYSPDFSVGSTYIRWGRTDCPDNVSLVYSGYAGGSSHDHTGAAANPLCLVKEPQLAIHHPLPDHYTLLYGAEYENVPGHADQEVPCALCLVPQSSTVMVPATLTCPPGWALQYEGYLMAGHHGHNAATEYVCVDREMENGHAGHENKNGHLFYHVVTQCGSLPCPPYLHNKVVTCVVCSV